MLTEDAKPYISSLKSGESVVGLMPESYYLEVTRTMTTWSFRIQSYNSQNKYNTTWVKVDEIYKLETSRLAKKIRRNLSMIYPGRGTEATEQVIALLELYESYWEPEIEDLVKKKEPTSSDVLVSLALKAEILLFCDQHNDPHIQIPSEITLNNPANVTGVTRVTRHALLLQPEKDISNISMNSGGEYRVNDASHLSHASQTFQTKPVYRLSSKLVKEWLAGLMWKTNEIAVKGEVIKSVVMILSSLARENPVIDLYNRVAKDAEGNWWLDLSNEKWQAVKITDEGWEVVDHPPILFRRYSHQRPLYMPIKNGSIAEFLDYIRLTDVDSQLLYLVSQISYLVPGIPHTITLLWGGKGTIKSTSQNITKKLLDNSSVGLISMPSKFKNNELTQQLDHHYIASYDNVGSIDAGQSDIFCRAVTGLGVSKRQLYTDDEDITRAFLRCISMNGINLPADKPDILDRAITHETIPTPKNMRKPLAEIEAKFEAEASSMLGAFLDVLVLARTFYNEVDLRSLNRMADFTKWGAAISEAMGIPYQKFLVAYQKNINDVEIESLRASTVGDTLIRFLEITLDRDKVLPNGEIEKGVVREKRYNPTELYQTIKRFAQGQQISTAKGDFPANPTEMGKKINEILPNLPSVGFKATRKRTRTERMIVFSRVVQTKIDEAMVYQEYLTDNVWKFDDLREHFGRNDINPVEESIEESTDQIDIDLLYTDKPRSLQNQLQKVLQVLSEMERISGSVKEVDMYETLATDFGLNRTEVARFIGVLMKDGTIYMPRPGYYRRSD